MRDVLSFLSKIFGFGSHTEPVPVAATPTTEPVSATVLEWLGWTGEFEGKTLAWVPGESH